MSVKGQCLRSKVKNIKRLLYGCSETTPAQEALILCAGLIVLILTSGLFKPLNY
jgi:hypothetical protein